MGDYFELDYDYVVENIVEAAGLLGIDITPRDYRAVGWPTTTYGLFWDQYFLASMDGSYRYPGPEAAFLIRHEYPTDKELHDIADRLDEAQPRPYSLVANIRCGHPGRTCIEASVDEDSGDGNYAAREAAYADQLDYPATLLTHKERHEYAAAYWRKFPFYWSEDDFEQAIRLFLKWAGKQLQAEYEYQMEHKDDDEG